MKSKTCPECEGIMEARTNCENKPVWACRCCWIETPRQIRNTKAKIAREAKAEELNDLINELLG